MTQKFSIALALVVSVLGWNARADLPAVECHSLGRAHEDPQIDLRIERGFGAFSQDAHLRVQNSQGSVTEKDFSVRLDDFGLFDIAYRSLSLDLTLEISLGFDRRVRFHYPYDATLTSSWVNEGRPLRRLFCQFLRF